LTTQNKSSFVRRLENIFPTNQAAVVRLAGYI